MCVITDIYDMYLYVLLDLGQSSKHHIAELSKKLARTVGIFYKVRHLISLETLKILYYLLFYSFEYGIRCIAYTGAKLWNMIPVSLRSSPSSSVFRSELKTYL